MAKPRSTGPRQRGAVHESTWCCARAGTYEPKRLPPDLIDEALSPLTAELKQRLFHMTGHHRRFRRPDRTDATVNSALEVADTELRVALARDFLFFRDDGQISAYQAADAVLDLDWEQSEMLWIHVTERIRELKAEYRDQISRSLSVPPESLNIEIVFEP